MSQQLRSQHRAGWSGRQPLPRCAEPLESRRLLALSPGGVDVPLERIDDYGDALFGESWEAMVAIAAEEIQQSFADDTYRELFNRDDSALLSFTRGAAQYLGYEPFQGLLDTTFTSAGLATLDVRQLDWFDDPLAGPAQSLGDFLAQQSQRPAQGKSASPPDVGIQASQAKVSITPATVSVIENETSVGFSIGVSNEPIDGFTVDWQTVSGSSATSPSDYIHSSGTLTFNDGDEGSSAPISVPIKEDTLEEADETFTVTLSNLQNFPPDDPENPHPAAINPGFSESTVTIIDDDPRVNISDAATVTESDPGQAEPVSTFTVTLSNSRPYDIYVNWATADGPPGNQQAVASTDFYGTTGQLLFTAGQTSKTIDVTIRNDYSHELTEFFYVNLTSASGAIIEDDQGLATIDDDDPQIDLDAHLVLHNAASGLLAEAEEATEGAYLPVNNDDDDYDVSNAADSSQAGAITGENDLLPLKLTKFKPSAGGNYILTIPNHIRVWKNPDRTDRVNHLTSTLDATQDWTLYAEATSQGSGYVTVHWTNGTSAITSADTVLVKSFTWNGPLNVPGYAQYQYTATGGRATDSTWVAPISGSNQGTVEGTTDEIQILWDGGPVVGKAVYQPRSGYTWDLDVNVVEIKIKPGPSNFVLTVGAPTQIFGPGSALISSNGAGDAMDAQIVVERIQGPLVNGSRRGEKFMEMGLVHQARFDGKRGLYDDSAPPKQRVSSLQDGLVHWDSVVSANIPWIFRDPTRDWLDVTADGLGIVDRTFRTSDTPELLGTTPFILAGDQVDRLVIQMHHWQYFAVRTKDPRVTDSPNPLTIRAEFEWNVDISGSISATGVYTPTAGVTGDTHYTEVTDGRRVADAAPNINELFASESWTTMDQ